MNARILVTYKEGTTFEEAFVKSLDGLIRILDVSPPDPTGVKLFLGRTKRTSFDKMILKSVHSIRLPDGREWDTINGWRD